MWSWANEPEANSHIATHGTQARTPRPGHSCEAQSLEGRKYEPPAEQRNPPTENTHSSRPPAEAGASGGRVEGQGAPLLRGALRGGAAARRNAAAHPRGAPGERRELDRALRRRLHEPARAGFAGLRSRDDSPPQSEAALSTRRCALAHAHPQPPSRPGRYNGWYGEIGQLEKGAAALAEKLDREHALLVRRRRQRTHTDPNSHAHRVGSRAPVACLSHSLLRFSRTPAAAPPVHAL